MRYRFGDEVTVAMHGVERADDPSTWCRCIVREGGDDNDRGEARYKVVSMEDFHYVDYMIDEWWSPGKEYNVNEKELIDSWEKHQLVTV